MRLRISCSAQGELSMLWKAISTMGGSMGSACLLLEDNARPSYRFARSRATQLLPRAAARASPPAGHARLERADAPGNGEPQDRQHHHARHQLIGLHQIAGLQHE